MRTFIIAAAAVGIALAAALPRQLSSSQRGRLPTSRRVYDRRSPDCLHRPGQGPRRQGGGDGCQLVR
jgi:hypothetical protein